MASSIRLILPLLTLGALAAAACSSDEEPRRGGPGASCLSTNDCEAPLSCIEQICGGLVTTSQGGSGAGGAGGTGGTQGSGGAIDAVGPGETLNVCDGCLDDACLQELNACDEDCLAVEMCLETQCRSALLSFEEEEQCQISCFQQHPGNTEAFLDVVNCSRQAFVGACGGECGSNMSEHPECVDTQTAGQCAGEAAACAQSADCTAYRNCTTTCASAVACLQCQEGPGGASGRALFETLNRCIALECMSESWLLPPS